jgi:hypothetical protein
MGLRVNSKLVGTLKNLHVFAVGTLTLTALAGCGNVDGTLKNLLRPSLDLDIGVTFTTEVDDAPADNEMVNVVIAKFKDERGNTAAGFTPVLSTTTGVSATCSSTNAKGESYCRLKSDTAGTATLSISNGVSALITSKTHTVTFTEKKSQAPGYTVSGGGATFFYDTDGSGNPTGHSRIMAGIGEPFDPIIITDSGNSSISLGVVKVFSNTIGIFASQNIHGN